MPDLAADAHPTRLPRAVLDAIILVLVHLRWNEEEPIEALLREPDATPYDASLRGRSCNGCSTRIYFGGFLEEQSAVSSVP